MRRKSTTNNKNEIAKKQCSKCLTEKNSTRDFYVSYSPIHSDGRVPVCKSCLENMFDDNNIESSLKEILRMIDKPYIHHLVESSMNEPHESFFRTYMKNSVMKQYAGMTWKDSLYSKTQRIDTENEYTPSNQNKVSYELVDKWGDYPPEEIILFEKKYQQLRVNYPERTAMHIEALQIYVRYRVKEELATQKGMFKEAEGWGKLAKEAATAAKINPSQLSKADLSDGLDSFSQLVRSVEQAVDIVDILPRFKERPKDKVDFTIWCYVNYIRDLKGLPLVEYKEIYEFYEARKREYETMSEGEEDDIF